MEKTEIQLETDFAPRIYVIRGRSVMLDSDLARIYCVSTTRLNQQYRRNCERFPKDFAFHLTRQEFTNLILQFATSSSAHGGRRIVPVVFAEHGAIMLASVLNSKVAIAASVNVVRAFVAMREAISRHKQLREKLAEIEGRLDGHDETLRELFAAIRQLLDAGADEGPRRQIGFHVKDARKDKQISAVGI